MPTVVAFDEAEVVTVCVRKIKAKDPVISAITPNTGSPGQLVTITGKNFYPRLFGVMFGTIAATIISRSPTALVVQVPAGVLGEVFVTVTNVNGRVSNPVIFTGP